MRRVVENDPLVTRFFEFRSIRAATMKGYVDALTNFCSFFDKSPSQLVEEFSKMSVDELVNVFRRWLLSQKPILSSKSLKNYTAAIRAFLLDSGVEVVDHASRLINREFRRIVGSVRPILKKDLITKDEIIKILKVASLREKAIITLMASSGLRVSAALSLRLHHFKDNLYDESLPCYAIEIPETLSKEGEPYITFCSWEAASYIREYLKSRELDGENVNLDSYLFISERKYSPLTPLSVPRFENIWRDLCSQSGVDLKPVKIKKHSRMAKGGKHVIAEGVRYNIRVHSLRKFFRTTLAISGVDRLAAEAMMGHSLLSFGVESIYNYAVSRLDYLRGEYLKALNNLLFLKEPRGMEIINGVARRRIEELEQKIEALEESIRFYEQLIKYLQKKNPRLLKELGID